MADLNTEFPTYILRDRGNGDPGGAFQRSFLQSRNDAAQERGQIRSLQARAAEREDEQRFELEKIEMRRKELETKAAAVKNIFSGAKSFEEVLDLSAKNPWLYYDRDTGPGMARMMQTYTSLKRAEDVSLDAKTKLQESVWYRKSLDEIAGASMQRAAAIRALPKYTRDGFLDPEVVKMIDDARFELNLNEKKYAPSPEERMVNFEKELRDAGDLEHADMIKAIIARRGTSASGSQQMLHNFMVNTMGMDKEEADLLSRQIIASRIPKPRLSEVQRAELDSLIKRRDALDKQLAGFGGVPLPEEMAAPLRKQRDEVDSKIKAISPTPESGQRIPRYNPSTGKIE